MENKHSKNVHQRSPFAQAPPALKIMQTVGLSKKNFSLPWPKLTTVDDATIGFFFRRCLWHLKWEKLSKFGYVIHVQTQDCAFFRVKISWNAELWLSPRTFATSKCNTKYSRSVFFPKYRLISKQIKRLYQHIFRVSQMESKKSYLVSYKSPVTKYLR